jgi:hypothetical protein
MPRPGELSALAKKRARRGGNHVKNIITRWLNNLIIFLMD